MDPNQMFVTGPYRGQVRAGRGLERQNKKGAKFRKFIGCLLENPFLTYLS